MYYSPLTYLGEKMIVIKPNKPKFNVLFKCACGAELRAEEKDVKVLYTKDLLCDCPCCYRETFIEYWFLDNTTRKIIDGLVTLIKPVNLKIRYGCQDKVDT